ncbi:MAG: hypothetical protein JW736_07865, partial [Deltaproteobacteria bacterium]|nr:hypothetical protein [Deltaproteobacteria bacterium]
SFIFHDTLLRNIPAPWVDVDIGLACSAECLGVAVAAPVTPYIKYTTILAKGLLTAIAINNRRPGLAYSAWYRTFYNYHS